MKAQVEHILGADGPIAKLLGATFEPRAEQGQMAAAVVRAMEARSHLLVEAGTGVGKSFAYLVPAVLRCLAGDVVVIATNTIALQEQLITKDIPLVQRALEEAGIIPKPRGVDDGHNESDELASSEGYESTGGFGSGDEPVAQEPFFKPVLVKGRGNYVSIRRLHMASERQHRLFGDPVSLRTLHVIEDWAKETLDGTLSTLPPLERPGVWDKVQSDSGNCMGRKCPQYRRCFYQQARREMESANLLVCNHALFFSDLALRAKDVGFLPAYQHVILDEAHAVEDVAAEHFGISLSEGRVMHLLSSLYQARNARGYLPQLQLAAGELDLVDRAVRLVLACENAARRFFDSLIDLQRGSGGKSGMTRSGRIQAADAVPNELSPLARELSLCLKSIREKIKGEPDRYELNAYSMRAAAIADDAEALVSQSLPGCAYWLESGGEDGETLRGGKMRRITMACSPVEVAPVLKEKLFDEQVSVVLTSATLALSGKQDASKSQDPFAHIKQRLGCEGADTLLLGSPFDLSRQLELYIERTMPRPESGARFARSNAVSVDDMDQRPPEERGSNGSHGNAASVPRRPMLEPGASSYNEVLASRILTHIDATDGGAFVLFTSFATLNAMAARLATELERREMPLLVQGRDGSRSLLLERFRENERSVLFGAASFWQGVDVRGRGLRNVIITRLPFDPPDRPLTEARLERITERGGDPFFEESLPRAVIKFKQGFGRLIRSKTDTGRVVVLDPRIVTTGYGRRFLEALPAGVRVRDEGRE